MTRTALVTGANRGMGLATARAFALRGFDVIGTTRQELDLGDASSIARFCERVRDVDILVNNAAVYLDEGVSVVDVDRDTLETTMRTNLFGPWLLCQAFVPGMMKRRWGRVVNVSSGAGQLASMTDFAPSYSASKAALNAMTRMFAAATKGRGVLVNSVDPGWVRTDMGGSHAPRSIEQGIDTIVWCATLPDDGPTGGFFHDRMPVAW